MRIKLFEIKKPGDNKDYNGGFGTTFEVGSSFRSKILALIRSNSENFPTMSYAYVSAIFKKFGHDVSYHLNSIEGDFDLLLMHVSMIRHREEKDYLRKIRKDCKGKIGVYGPLATVRPDLYSDLADLVITGEPEEAVIKMAETGQIPTGVIKSNPIMDLDQLPFPDWHFFPLSTYSFSPILPLRPFTFVLASRGCPYQCFYCPYKVFGDYRARKPEKVVEELLYLKNEFGIRAFYFRDPTFSINRDRIVKLAELMIGQDVDLKWGCETRSDLLDIPLLELLYQAGLRAIKMGIESPDHDLLRKNKRLPPDIAHQEEIIRYCQRKGIKIIAFYMIGFPEDTHDSIKKMLRYSRKLNTSFANFTICTPIPGTAFYEKIKNDIFDEDFNHYDNFHSVFSHPNLSAKEILKYQEEAICGYYFRPGYIYRFLYDTLRFWCSGKGRADHAK